MVLNNFIVSLLLPLSSTHIIPAYGTVFRARHKTHGRIVALKRFCVQTEGSEELGQHEPPLNVLREISILKLLKHPNIVNILDIAADGKEPRDVFMAMEYCEQVGPL